MFTFPANRASEARLACPTAVTSARLPTRFGSELSPFQAESLQDVVLLQALRHAAQAGAVRPVTGGRNGRFAAQEHAGGYGVHRKLGITREIG